MTQPSTLNPTRVVEPQHQGQRRQAYAKEWSAGAAGPVLTALGDKPARKPIAIEDRAVMECVARGYRLPSIARVTGQSRSEVTRIVRSYGWEVETKNGLIARPGEPAAEEAGPDDVAAFFGVDGQVVNWRDLALCAQVDPDIFFPEKGGSVRAAKKVCEACDVQDECLEYALEHKERFGIWGGVTERNRRQMLADRGDLPDGLDGEDADLDEEDEAA